MLEIFFHKDTSTFCYVVSDNVTKKCAIIDSALDYDHYSGRTSTIFADQIISYIKSNQLTCEYILETHIHADHLTAASYLKKQIGGKIGIGEKIKEVLDFWVPIFNSHDDTNSDCSQFDLLFYDGQEISLGSKIIKIIHTPGHTPACLSYLIDDMIFVGDSIFMPDIGTARTDFPGGNAGTLYDSIQKIFALPDHFKIYVGHDYPPAGREVMAYSTVGEQKKSNILINESVNREKYISIRNKRDENKPVPKLLLPSIQVNLRSGEFGNKESNNVNYIKIPINKI